ncbi:hypothetical protein [Actinomadura sp. WAC 06369]|uniref:hypothetical protein n=1 Tax=Actinomadura sp. WAC 06369 TaxID=2203193 RepID=UPI000F7AC9FE|nr:hypothetical protein [Actinomadura sp. WAC 06369]RSN51507.1 hypothetical protein DMH08_30490 [Actinomadura sp. WAC 06369]
MHLITRASVTFVPWNAVIAPKGRSVAAGWGSGRGLDNALLEFWAYCVLGMIIALVDSGFSMAECDEKR